MVARTPTMTVRTVQNETTTISGQPTGLQALSRNQGSILISIKVSSASARGPRYERVTAIATAQ